MPGWIRIRKILTRLTNRLDTNPAASIQTGRTVAVNRDANIAVRTLRNVVVVSTLDEVPGNLGVQSIKLIPPKDYDGEADSRAYHRFVMEGEAYLRDGKVPRERQIRIFCM